MVNTALNDTGRTLCIASAMQNIMHCLCYTASTKQVKSKVSLPPRDAQETSEYRD